MDRSLCCSTATPRSGVLPQGQALSPVNVAPHEFAWPRAVFSLQHASLLLGSVILGIFPSGSSPGGWLFSLMHTGALGGPRPKRVAAFKQINLAVIANDFDFS